MQRFSLFIFAALLIEVYTAPQFITFKEGKLGVNFGGYHAGVGLGGILGGGGSAGGGLFAEAGTPFGQAAKAGLGGAVDGNSGTAGGLYAGATAGGNVKAEAGLGGVAGAERTAGEGFATAQSGGHYAASGLGGQTGLSGSSGFSVSAHKSIGVAPTVVKETEVSVVPIEEVRPIYKNVHTEAKLEAANEIKPAANAGFQANAGVEVKANAQPAVIVKEITYVEPTWLMPPQLNYVQQVYVEQPPRVIEKTIIKTRKPHRHHLRKTAYIGGYIGGGAGVAAPETTVVHKVQPILEKRIDVGAAADAHANAGATAYHGGNGEVTYTKKVSVASNPTFFQDIFNIPISTLKAVSSLLTNAAGSTKFSVEKSASIQAGAGAETDLISAKHVHPSSLSSSSSSQSEAHISVQTPSATKIIDDIFAIPINTLSAVNKFLENNAARKKVQISAEGSGEPTRVHLGPHARRRANKQVVVVEEPTSDIH